LILLVVANVQIKQMELASRRAFGAASAAAENPVLVWFVTHNPSSAASAMSFSSLGAGKFTPGSAIHQPAPIPTLRPSM
jgi:hypothetical protein